MVHIKYQIPGVGEAWSVEYQPGNGQRYLVTFAQVVDQRGCPTVGWAPNSWLVALPDRNKAYVFAEETYLHWTFVQEKMHLGTDDAKAVTKLIGLQLDIETSEDENDVQADSSE